MADEGLIIKITADAKEFISGAEKAVKDAKGKFKGLGDEIGKELRRVETVGTKAFMGITGAIGAAVAGVGTLITKGTTYNQNLEQQVKSLEILLGSTEKANQMMNELKEYDKISPFDLSQLAEASKQMLAYGIETDKVIPLLKQFGDISMGDQDKVLALALAFSQCSATGKLVGQDLNQMINAGFNPLEYISKKTGKSIAELKEEMAKGAITVEMVEDAFRMATSEGERFYKATEKGSQTVQGRLSILEADFEAFCGKIAEGFTKTFGDEILPMAENYMERISNAFTEGGFKGLVIELGNILGELVDVVVQKAPELVDMGVDIVKAILKGIMDNIYSITTAADTLVTIFAEGIRSIMPRLLTIAKVMIGTILEGFIEYKTLIMEMGIQIITTLVSGIADAAPTLAPQVVDAVMHLLDVLIENLPTLIDSALKIITELANAIMAKLPELLSKIGQVIYDLVNKLFATIDTWGPALLKIIAAILAMVADAIVVALVAIFQNLGKWWNSSVKPWLDKVGDNIAKWFDGVKTSAKTKLDNIKAVVKGIVEMIKTDVKTKIEEIKTSISEKVEAIKTGVKEKVDAVKTSISEKVESIKSTVSEKVTAVKTKVTEVVTAIKTKVTETVGNLKTSISEKISAIKTNITTKISEIKTTVSEKVRTIAETVVNTIKEIPGKMLSIGRDIVEGLWNGILGAGEWLKGKVTGFFSGITDWVKGVFDEHSPSKVFKKIGSYLTEGLAIGIEDGNNDLKRTTQKQLDQLKSMYSSINLGMPQLNLTGKMNALRMGQSVQTITNDNGNVFNFTNYFTGSGAEAGDELFRQFQRRVRYSGGVL